MLTPGCKVVACRCGAFFGHAGGGDAKAPAALRARGGALLGGMEAACVVGLSDVVARLLACRRRYVDGGLVRPSVALVGLGVGRGLYDDASPNMERAMVRSGPSLHDVPLNTVVDLLVPFSKPPTA